MKKKNKRRTARCAQAFFIILGVSFLGACSSQPDVNVDVPICNIDQPVSPLCRRAPQIYSPDIIPFPDMAEG